VTSTLHIYRDQETILAVHAEDTTEYSAIYMVNPENGEVSVASNLADINGDLWSPLEWLKALTDLLCMDHDLVMFYRVVEPPQDVEEKFLHWMFKEDYE